MIKQWIDDGDCYICPQCGYETSSPLNNPLTDKGNTQCPTCCWQADDASNPSVIRYREKLKNPKNDPVNHPSHYTKGKIEVADFIADQKLNFDRGNAVKYVCRAGSKDPDKEIQDLEKAIWYINHEIKMLKGETENE